MHNILVYSFHHQKKRNISSEIASRLKNVDKFSVDCTTNASGMADVHELIQLIESNNYEYIVGFGIYSSKDFIVKIEKEAKNKFRNEKILTNLPDHYSIGEFLNSNLSEVVTSSKMGNSWCNYSAYLIRHIIISRQRNSQNGFIHIPNNFVQMERISNISQSLLSHLV